MPQRMRDYRAVSAYMDSVVTMRRIWGSPVGVSLVEATLNPTHSGWVTAQGVANRVGVSDDTARRQLDSLVNIGRAIARDVGRKREYRATMRYVQRTTATIKSLSARLKP